LSLEGNVLPVALVIVRKDILVYSGQKEKGLNNKKWSTKYNTKTKN
jgi:hypothetical protein